MNTRTRTVRHRSRALHQVSVCVRKSARHSQVRSPNMRTSQHNVAANVRVVHICSSKSWLTRTNATGRNDLQIANTLIPRNQSCSRYATIDDFSCTETQADGSLFPKASEKTFFLFEMSRSKQQAKQQKFWPNQPGGRARLFFSFFYLFHLFN